MKKKKFFSSSLTTYIDSLQSKGSYVLLRENAIAELGVSSVTFNMAVFRLIKKNRLVSAGRGFYVIVPLEYRSAGSIPASWFIDQMMNFRKQPYYVGLLSAAALYGATHQQPQEFQVMTNNALRPITVGRTLIRFFTKKDINTNFVDKIKTATGYMNVSTPELTALDLLNYIAAVGHIHNISTIFRVLAEKIDGKKLAKTAAYATITVVQRLGYLLDTYASKTKAQFLYPLLNKKNPPFTPLVAGRQYKKSKVNLKWRIWVNEKIEIDV